MKDEKELQFRITVISEQTATLTKIEQQLRGLTEQRKELNKSVKAGTVSEAEAAKISAEIRVQNTALLAQRRDTQKVIELQNKAINSEIGSVIELEAKYKLLIRQLNLMGEAGRKTELGIGLAKQADEINNTLKDVDATTGRFQRNVGNYALAIQQAGQNGDMLTQVLRQMKTELAGLDQSTPAFTKLNNNINQVEASIAKLNGNVNRQTRQFNGLANSINQISREMPAFAFSVQTGFLALSNNIPILTDEINRLKAKNLELAASGQPVVSVSQQIIKSIFSWQTAMSLIISVITIFGPKIYELITGTKELTAAQKESEKQQEENAKTLEKNINAYKVFKGELTESEAAFQNLISEMSIGLEKIQKESEKEIASINGFWNTLFTNIVGGFGFVKGETIRLIDEAKEKARAANEEQKLINKFIDDANGKAIEIANSYRQKVRDLRNDQIKNELEREKAKINELRRIEKEKVTLEFTDIAVANDAKAEIDKAFDLQIENATKAHNEKQLKEAEDHANNMRDLIHRINESEIALIKDKFTRERAEEAERHRFQLEQFEQAKKEEPELTAFYNDLITLENKQHYANESKLLIDFEADQKKIRDAAYQDLQETESKKRQVRLSGVKDVLDEYDKAKSESDKNVKKTDEDDLKKREDDQKIIASSAISSAQNIANTISQIKQQALQRDLQRETDVIKASSDTELSILKNQLDKGLITEAQFAKKKDDLDKATAAKQLIAQKNAFEEKKKLDTRAAIMNGALAITSILAQYPKFDFGIAAAAAIVAAGITTGAQVATIQAQEFANSGLVQPEELSSGKIKVNPNIPTKKNGDNVLATVKVGEVILNEQHQAMLGGDETFRRIGVPGFAGSGLAALSKIGRAPIINTTPPVPVSFLRQDTGNFITKDEMKELLSEHSRNLANTINSKKVGVLESDIRKATTNIDVYESESTF